MEEDKLPMQRKRKRDQCVDQQYETRQDDNSQILESNAEPVLVSCDGKVHQLSQIWFNDVAEESRLVQRRSDDQSNAPTSVYEAPAEKSEKRCDANSTVEEAIDITDIPVCSNKEIKPGESGMKVEPVNLSWTEEEENPISVRLNLPDPQVVPTKHTDREDCAMPANIIEIYIPKEELGDECASDRKIDIKDEPLELMNQDFMKSEPTDLPSEANNLADNFVSLDQGVKEEERLNSQCVADSRRDSCALSGVTMVCVSDARFTNTDFITEFIEIYKTHTCLWQVKSPEYSNRVKRDSAYKSLLTFCQTVNPDCDVSFVKKKIGNLRNAFRKEHAKVRKSTKSGAGANEIYVPKLWYYKLQAFTGDHEEPRESFCSIDSADHNEQPTPEDNQCDQPDVEVENGQVAQPSYSTNSSTPMKPPSRKGLKRKVCQVDNLVEEAMSVLQKPDDSCDSFGRYIATELRELNKNQRVLAKQKISDIICQAQLNKLVDGQHHTVYKPVYYNSGYYTNSTPDYQPSPSPSPSDCSDSNVSYTNM